MADGNTSEWRGNGDAGIPLKFFEKVQNRSGTSNGVNTPPPPAAIYRYNNAYPSA